MRKYAIMGSLNRPQIGHWLTPSLANLVGAVAATLAPLQLCPYFASQCTCNLFSVAKSPICWPIYTRNININVMGSEPMMWNMFFWSKVIARMFYGDLRPVRVFNKTNGAFDSNSTRKIVSVERTFALRSFENQLGSWRSGRMWFLGRNQFK